MLRDQIADKESLELRINIEIEFIEDWSSRLRSGLLERKDVELRTSEVWGSQLSLLVMKYTAGEPLSALNGDVRNLCDSDLFLPEVWGCPGRSESWRALAFALLLGVTNSDLENLSKLALFKRSKPFKRDDLFYRLLETRIDIPADVIALETDGYDQGLVEIIETAETDKDLASEQLCKFVKSKWYNKNRANAWWGSHKDPFSYDGYWAFEAAAVAHVFQLDDSPLEDHKYYPYELAHYLPNPS